MRHFLVNVDVICQQNLHALSITSLHCLVDGGRQVHLELGLGSKLQQHADARRTATAASIEEGCGSVNGHSIDLV